MNSWHNWCSTARNAGTKSSKNRREDKDKTWFNIIIWRRGTQLKLCETRFPFAHISCDFSKQNWKVLTHSYAAWMIPFKNSFVVLRACVAETLPKRDAPALCCWFLKPANLWPNARRLDFTEWVPDTSVSITGADRRCAPGDVSDLSLRCFCRVFFWQFCFTSDRLGS